MSIAGKRSNRGDFYQTLVAFDWALRVLDEPEFQWLEIDSVTQHLDDIVIGKTDRSLICCQCKKNQIDFKPWTIANLGDELDKAFLTLANNQHSQACFYSRNNFGLLGKLCEYSRLFSNEAQYLENLASTNQNTHDALSSRLAEKSPNLTAYSFLSRTSFEVSPELEPMEALLHERLNRMASNSANAFNALWVQLDKLGGGIGRNGGSVASQHRLTKDDIKGILHQSGAMLSPQVSVTQVRTAFANTSSIGRSWHRDIAGQRIPNPVVQDLLASIDANERSILLTGLPGSGKTCVMLELQEALEQRSKTETDLVPLFIQSREFADSATAQERQAQGLAEQWVAQAARLAENTRVVVIIDSLDVLSIAREHSVLSYFLAQIDQLLLIPNITVITACRDFDRKYDLRIAARQWDCELQCQPLGWDVNIMPLLDRLGIDATTIDTSTRELIQNPRELALFVELAQRDGSFNIVTSQALAQRYLNTVIQSEPLLGDTAMQAIEAIADAMLKSRSLSVPRQRFSASPETLRQLRSLNVLQQTDDDKLTFGHQTLLDVLVISGAIRQGISLNSFIQSLPPVPFVRPSIRSFVSQLAAGERRDFRKQVRAVLTSTAAFHIRRLVAESFAQLPPHDDDWPLIRDLRNNHREVFQVIYTQATAVDWHHFWFKYLVPQLQDLRDAEGLTAHIYRIAPWANDDPSGVMALWLKALTLDWLDRNSIAEQLAYSLTEINTEHLHHAAPLLKQLINMPIPEHSSLGRAAARFLTANAIGDELLWQYIISDISESDLTQYRFNNKLHCQPYEFGDKNDHFLAQRMVQSTALLDLALEAIERWSTIISTHYGETRTGYRYGLLSSCSYNDTHSQVDHSHVDSGWILFNAVEAAILDHTQNHSNWWQNNRERLSASLEGTLCYFVILACTKSPESNLGLIAQLLSNKNLLQFSFSFELGTLVQAAFIHLDHTAQDSVMALIQTVWDEPDTDENSRKWILYKQSEFISAIPCHLRSPQIQTILDSYEKSSGPFIRQPSILMRSGTVSAPFSFEVFLSAHETGVIDLLTHYTEHSRDHEDFSIGGERDVGQQLLEASSRAPSRFLTILSSQWDDISTGFSNDIMEGAVNYLTLSSRNSKANDTWKPIEAPEANVLTNQILDELERHPAHWLHNYNAAKAIKACAHVVVDARNATRLVRLAIDFDQLEEEPSISGDSMGLLTAGINMQGGNIAEALMILANNFQKQNIILPELLTTALRLFSRSRYNEIRVLILHRLPYLQSQNPTLGWELFDLTMQRPEGLWSSAEPCLYHAYYAGFERVKPLLERIYGEGNKEDMKTWGRISALSTLTGHINFTDFIRHLHTLNITEAWEGAMNVWTNTENINQHREQCFTGVRAGLTSNTHAKALATHADEIFQGNTLVPIDVIQRYFDTIENDDKDRRHHLYGFNEWLNVISQRDPKIALAVTEIYLPYVKRSKPYFHDHDNQLVQLMTRLFAEAEELEESDNGAMLNRVVSVQDLLLSLGGSSINEWLSSAERQ